jgi:hypothetical protein
MGAGQSLPNQPNKNVFAAELEKLNDLVTKVLTKDDKFANPDYNFLFEDVCTKYTIIWEKELSKHLKIDLQGISGSLYLLPKKDSVTSDDDKVIVNKQDICSSISKHYVKVLYILSLLRTVYDLENDGDDSLAGIMQRNIKVSNNLMEISYCSVPHRDYSTKNADKIDFANLQGLQMFVEHFLTPVEKYAFLQQMKVIFARKSRNKVADSICHDALVSLDVYKKVYAEKFPKGLGCEATIKPLIKSARSVDLMFEIAENNPIMHTQYCMAHKKIVVSLTNKDKETKKVVALYDAMHANYKSNIDKVMRITDKIVDKHGDKYKLKNISNQQLEEIIKEVKQVVILFFVQSIVDFQVLLDHAKTISPIKI